MFFESTQYVGQQKVKKKKLKIEKGSYGSISS